MNKYQEDYYEFIKDLKYINELINSLTIEQRKSLGATTYSIQGILGRYTNEEKDFVKELVDRETPIKPIKMEKNYYICGSCEYHIPNSNESKTWHKIFQPYCTSCGQVIDWSNEN